MLVRMLSLLQFVLLIFLFGCGNNNEYVKEIYKLNLEGISSFGLFLDKTFDNPTWTLKDNDRYMRVVFSGKVTSDMRKIIIANYMEKMDAIVSKNQKMSSDNKVSALDSFGRHLAYHDKSVLDTISKIRDDYYALGQKRRSDLAGTDEYRSVNDSLNEQCLEDLYKYISDTLSAMPQWSVGDVVEMTFDVQKQNKEASSEGVVLPPEWNYSLTDFVKIIQLLAAKYKS